MTAAEERQSQQHNAGSRRPQEVGAPAQAMVSGGLVFVHFAKVTRVTEVMTVITLVALITPGF